MNLGIGRFLRDGFTQEGVERAFRRVVAGVTAGFLIEHKEDGTHSAVTADSLTLGSDPLDGSWDGNVGSSLVPTADGLDLGAVVTGQDGSDPLDHPWQDLRLSGTLYVGAAWEATIVDGIPTIEREVNGLTIDIQGQSEFTVTGSTAGELQMTAGNLSYDGNFDAGGAVTAGNDGFFERGRSTAMGVWTTPSFNAGDFTGSGTISWTVAAGDVNNFAYTLIGKTMIVQFTIITTTVSGTGVELRIAIPGGFTGAKLVNTPIRVSDNGTFGIGYARVAASGTVIGCFLDATGATNWAAATDATEVRGEIIFEVA